MSAPSSAPLLDIDRVTKRFGGLVANDAISMQVQAGEIVGIIGPNGSGKTTLFTQISGFAQPTSGSISFAGEELTGLLPDEVNKRGVARTFQIVQPFGGLTVLDNIMIGTLARGYSMAAAREKSKAVLDFVGMGERFEYMASALTLPEMKRLEVAKALSTEPKLLLLDEIMAGLRPTEVDQAVELVKRIRGNGITILFVEHLMRAVMALSERLYVLHHGETIASGNPKDVLQDSVVVDAYFGDAKNIA